MLRPSTESRSYTKKKGAIQADERERGSWQWAEVVLLEQERYCGSKDLTQAGRGIADRGHHGALQAFGTWGRRERAAEAWPCERSNNYHKSAESFGAMDQNKQTVRRFLDRHHNQETRMV
jgi:hypothetical protein